MRTHRRQSEKKVSYREKLTPGNFHLRILLIIIPKLNRARRKIL